MKKTNLNFPPKAHPLCANNTNTYWKNKIQTYVFVIICAIILCGFVQISYAEDIDTVTSTEDIVITIVEPDTAENISTTSTEDIVIEENEENTTSTEQIAEDIEEEIGLTNRVVISYLNETLFDNIVFTTSTYFVDAQDKSYSSVTTTALGAVMQASRDGHIDIDVLDFSWGYYVSSVNNIIPEGFDGWIYTINFSDPGYAGINDYNIADGDVVSLFYSVWPYKIEADVTSTTQGEDILFHSYSYSDDGWILSANTTISINNELLQTDETATYRYTTTATGTVEAFIYGSADWPSNSPSIKVDVLQADTTEEHTTTTSTTSSGGTTNNTSNTAQNQQTEESNKNITNQTTSGVDTITIQNTIDKLLNYITSQQHDDGSIIDGPTSDWLTMSFASVNMYAKDVQIGDKSFFDYISQYDLSDPIELNICASYPRHILALRASGIARNHNDIRALRENILTNCHTDIYGRAGINDDVFALFALLDTGSTVDDSIIVTILKTIIDDQQADGSFTWAGWSSPDISGVAINALTYAQGKGAVINANILNNAKDYLKATQLADGGWGTEQSDILNTSWVLMGITALGEGQDEWTNSNGKNPFHVMTSLLHEDGYYESPWLAGTVDWFSMKHALPALAGQPWPQTLSPIYFSSENNTNDISTPSNSITPTPTTTENTIIETIPDTTTTTIDITTSTAIIENTKDLNQKKDDEDTNEETTIQKILGQKIEVNSGVKIPVTPILYANTNNNNNTINIKNIEDITKKDKIITETLPTKEIDQEKTVEHIETKNTSRNNILRNISILIILSIIWYSIKKML